MMEYFFWAIAVLCVYFLPALISAGRGHRNANPIAVLNLFLGWTFVGWVVALCWAFTDNVAETEE